MLVSVSQNDVPNRAVRKRAVVQRHWLRALRKLLLPGYWIAGRCVLVHGLSSVLEGVTNAKFAERLPQELHRRHCCDLIVPANTTGLAIEPAQLHHTVCKQQLPSVFSPHMLHETSICRCRVSVGNWATLRAAEVLPGHLFRLGGLLSFLIVGGGGAGRAAGPAGESEIRRFWTALVTGSWLLGTVVSSFVDPSVNGVGLLCYRPVSGVCGRFWVLRFTDTDSSVHLRGPGRSVRPVPPRAGHIHA